MKNLKPYPKCSKEAYNNSIKSKQRETKQKLRSIKTQVFVKYDAYSSDLPTLKEISTSSLSAQNKEALLGAYQSKTKEFQAVLDEIRAIQDTSYLRQYCQYCGVNLSKSNDHYFPKEDYTFYTIFPINLVPCCLDCNGKKGKRIYKVTGERRFINFYYDNLDGKCFLECSITYDENIPIFTFGLEFDATFDPDFKIIVEEHFANLGLIEKYKDISEAEFDLISEEFSESNFVITEVESLVKSKMKTHEKQLGYNHYKTALLRGMLGSIQKFVEFLNIKFGDS